MHETMRSTTTTTIVEGVPCGGEGWGHSQGDSAGLMSFLCVATVGIIIVTFDVAAPAPAPASAPAHAPLPLLLRVFSAFHSFSCCCFLAAAATIMICGRLQCRLAPTPPSLTAFSCYCCHCCCSCCCCCCIQAKQCAASKNYKTPCEFGVASLKVL